MLNTFRQALNDGRYRDEWNSMSKAEQDKFAKTAGAFSPYAHFVEVRAQQDDQKQKGLTY
jgi:hypothetical protein